MTTTIHGPAAPAIAQTAALAHFAGLDITPVSLTVDGEQRTAVLTDVDFRTLPGLPFFGYRTERVGDVDWLVTVREVRA